MNKVQWQEIQNQLPVGSSVSGIVKQREVYGVFVKIDAIAEEHEALLQVIAFRTAKQRPSKFPEDYPDVGSQIETKIAYYSTEIGKLRLTQLEEDPHNAK